MDDDSKLNLFLAGPALKALQDYANELAPELLNHCPGSAVSVEYFRTNCVDWDAVEIVIVDTIEFRISGPSDPGANESAASDRRARRAVRGRGGRKRRGRNG
jgi:hypothetical protein